MEPRIVDASFGRDYTLLLVVQGMGRVKVGHG